MDARKIGPAGIAVSLKGTSLGTRTDSTGRFEFRGLTAAVYRVVVAPPMGPLIEREVRLNAGQSVELTIELDQAGTELEPVVVTAARPLHVIGHLPALRDNTIYLGKKSEVILLDSLHANLAQDVERQILGRIPGAHFSETARAGFPSNGVGFRGLNPTQSVELNTRQNGVSIAADLYGYPETYYTPPSQALERIEVVRGAGSLAFGPQFGGSINYVVRQGTPGMRPVFSADLSTGSFDMLNGFGAVRGGTARVGYHSFVSLLGEDGWRPNSGFRQVTASGGATLVAASRLNLGLEYTLFRNRIHMPGGLSDAQFTQDPRASFRARNWLASPWNSWAGRVSYRWPSGARWETLVSWQASDRHLVWRSEDGGPAEPDAIDPGTGSFVPREVEREQFHNAALESRVSLEPHWLGRPGALAAGVRLGRNQLNRFEGGPGSTGSDFDMGLYGGTWERALRFRTVTGAAFVEAAFRPTDRLALVPGVRAELLRSTAAGYTEVTGRFAPRSLAYPLFGIGAEYVTTGSSVLYANLSQAYRPVLYAALTPVGSIARVAPDLHSSRGYNADFGWRGTLGNLIKFDLSGFLLYYGGRIGTRTVDSAGGSVVEIANIGDSRHRGVEAYVELDPPGLRGLDLFSSFAFVDARYVSGSFQGNRVEQAPRVIERGGVSFGRGPFAGTLQLSYSSSSFGDANNSVLSTENAAAGLVPAYTVLDWSGQVRLNSRLTLAGGINNLANLKYFTKRTDEYPGPGILPGVARSVYVSLATSW